jgi:hypothetical protein
LVLIKQEVLALQVHKERQVLREQLVLLVQRDLQVRQVRKAQLVQLGLRLQLPDQLVLVV